jgi:mRNA-degrading endonuclease toxin of MazEF toxin-antitoxin module
VYERGAVCIAQLPELGNKFVVVVSPLAINVALRPIVVRITSVERPRSIPTAVPLAHDRIEGLDDDSIAVCHDIFTIPNDVLMEHKGQLSETTLGAIDAAVAVAVGLSR